MGNEGETKRIRGAGDRRSPLLQYSVVKVLGKRAQRTPGPSDPEFIERARMDQESKAHQEIIVTVCGIDKEVKSPFSLETRDSKLSCPTTNFAL
jgi:hypothetical protein